MVEGESSASARLVALSYYMARWLSSPKALNNYVEQFKSRAIVPPRYITANFIHVYHGKNFTGGIVADEKWSEYERLIGLQKVAVVW
ncbi:hypothetical protein HN51_027873, partial [Arachis hypogaea]